MANPKNAIALIKSILRNQEGVNRFPILEARRLTIRKANSEPKPIDMANVNFREMSEAIFPVAVRIATHPRIVKGFVAVAIKEIFKVF